MNRSSQTPLCEQDFNTQYAVDRVQVAKKPFYSAIKRCFDIVFSLIVAVVLLLPMIVISILIRLDSPGPAIFKQKRVGKNGKTFVMYKFRTMRSDAPDEIATRDFKNSEEYITRIGAFLRRTSLDELPQIFNILSGKMSIVGYRPVCLTETNLNELREAYGVFAAKPGLTGLAQVSGRDNLTAEEKAAIDAEYVRKRGIKLDFWCLIKTVAVVFSGEGVM